MQIASSFKPQNAIERNFAISTFVNTFGNGLFLVIAVLYFTRILDFSAQQIGLALTLGGLAELIITIPSGHVADRISPRTIAIATGFAFAMWETSFFFIADYWQFVFVLVIQGLLDGFSRTARQSMYARAAAPEDRVRFRAYLRAMTNVGIGLGSAVGALAIMVDERWAYFTVIGIDIATYFVSALLLFRVPNIEPHPQARDHHWTLALRDRPFIALTILNAIFTTHFILLDTIIPLWIIHDTNAPKAMIAITFLINTAMAATLQMKLSKGTEDVGVAAKSVRTASWLLFAATATYAFTSKIQSWLLVAIVLAAAAAIHVLGEITHAAGGWGISMGLPPESAMGQYQGLWLFGQNIGTMLAPALLTALIIGRGTHGWLTLGAIYVIAGLLVVRTSKWALAERESVVN
jgi:MFS family permease